MNKQLIRIRQLMESAFFAILILGASSVFGEEWQLDYGRLGPVKIGMTPSQVEKVTGQILAREKGGCAMRLPNKKKVDFYFNLDIEGKWVLTGILIYSPIYRTSKGIGMGSLLSEIEDTYGKTQPVGNTWGGKPVFTTVDHFVEDNHIINLAPPTKAVGTPYDEGKLMQFEIGKLSPKSRVKTVGVGWILGTELCG